MTRNDPRNFFKALGGVGSATSETLQGSIQARPDGRAPSILIESAEGIATFPGLNGDAESLAARAFIARRRVEIAAQTRSVARHARYDGRR